MSGLTQQESSSQALTEKENVWTLEVTSGDKASYRAAVCHCIEKINAAKHH